MSLPVFELLFPQSTLLLPGRGKLTLSDLSQTEPPPAFADVPPISADSELRAKPGISPIAS